VISYGPGRPGGGGGAENRGIGSQNAPRVGIERPIAFFRRQQPKEISAQGGKEARKRAEKFALQFGAAAEKGRAQHEAGDALGICLRVSQRQGRTPGAAGDQPTFKTEFLADDLQIRDQVLQRVGLARAFRPAAAAAALVEVHDTLLFGVEKAALFNRLCIEFVEEAA